MQSIVLVGAAGQLGVRVAARLATDDPPADDFPARVVALDDRPAAPADLKGAFDDVDIVISLSSDVDLTRAVLDAAGSAGVDRVVVVSSATVYGVWANNPVPLTEDAPLRPNPGFDAAVQSAEIERVAAEWRDNHPSSTVAILRPTVVVGEGGASRLARGLRSAASLRAAEDEPPAQFVHVDDVAAAVDLAARRRLDGVFNVAPDGWIPGERVRALAGGPRLRLPERLGSRLATWRWRLHLAPTPPSLLPYAVHPWVVANDRMRATGWVPQFTNEEAFVAGSRPGPLATVSPQRRQELALGGASAVLLGAAAAAFALIRRGRRRR